MRPFNRLPVSWRGEQHPATRGLSLETASSSSTGSWRSACLDKTGASARAAEAQVVNVAAPPVAVAAPPPRLVMPPPPPGQSATLSPTLSTISPTLSTLSPTLSPMLSTLSRHQLDGLSRPVHGVRLPHQPLMPGGPILMLRGWLWKHLRQCWQRQDSTMPPLVGCSRGSGATLMEGGSLRRRSSTPKRPINN